MLIYLLLGIVISLLFYIINILIYLPRRSVVSENELMITYECGFDTIQNQARTQHSINYYLIALLYVVFDLEIALLLPALATLSFLGMTGGVLLSLIMTLLTAAMVYEIRLGTFNFVNPLQI